MMITYGLCWSLLSHAISEDIFNLVNTILKKKCEITFPQLFNRKGKVINFDPFLNTVRNENTLWGFAIFT